MTDDAVIWHDLECGAYDADLPLWRELAAAAGGPVLDLGAGTGRVALELGRLGHPVVALDRSPTFVSTLSRRAAGLPVEAVCADARDFDLGDRRFALCVLPMQTIQLLGGARGRAGLLRCARRHLEDRALLAATLADPTDGFDPANAELPLPDLVERDGFVYASQPVAVRPGRRATAIERIRQTVTPTGERTAAPDVVELDHLTVARLAGEAEALGFEALPSRRIDATADHVGSEVVMLRAR
jgi:SAM-dependent methyltransferase